MQLLLLLAGAAPLEVNDGAPAGANRPTETTPSGQEKGTAGTGTSAATSVASVDPVFGQTYTYGDGLAGTIDAPQPYTPLDTAATGEPAPPAFVAFDVTVVNGTQANYEPSQFFIIAEWQ